MRVRRSASSCRSARDLQKGSLECSIRCEITRLTFPANIPLMQNDELIGGLHLAEHMGGPEYAQAATAEGAHVCQEQLAAGNIKTGGSLIDNQELGSTQQRPRDLHTSTQAARETAPYHLADH
jgi:hypothetical protein